jgi:predicted nuclease with TOPRIM domain
LEASLQEVLRENTKLSSDLAACQSELVKATKELAHAADSQTAVEDLASFKNAEVERLRDRVDALQQVHFNRDWFLLQIFRLLPFVPFVTIDYSL